MRILFVCLGNICRSPAAEAVMKKVVVNRSRYDIEIDSAGTINYHEGNLSDVRMINEAQKRSIEITSRSRQVTKVDFYRSDYIVVMDKSNLSDLLSIKPNDATCEIVEMMHYSSYPYEGVPDPYYGGDDGFREVLDILEESCENLCNEIIVKRKL